LTEYLACPRAILYGAASDFLEADVAHAIAAACTDPVLVAGIAAAHHHLMADQPIALATGIEALIEGMIEGLAAGA
jgi:hypothetical protein